MTPPASCLILAEEVWGSALHAIRSLGRAGVDVYVATAGQGAAIYGRSRYCADAADFDPTDPDRLCDDVLAWAERRIGAVGDIVVIPLSDRLVEALDRSREKFGARYRLSIPSRDATGALLDKARSFAIAEAAGLNVPRWVTIDDETEIGLAESLRLPLAVRPSSWSSSGDDYFKVVVFSDAETLSDDLSALLRTGARLIVQEYVVAAEHDVELGIAWRSRDGGATAVCTGRKRRQAAPEGGVMVWGEAEDLPDVRRAAVQFMDEAGYAGLGGIELIRSGGDLWFIEFNPRLEAIHFLAARAGLDTVVMEFHDLATGTTPSSIPEQRPATAWIGSAWLSRLMNDPGSWRSAVGDRIDFGRSPRRVRAVWTWTDPVPGLAITARLASRGGASLVQRRRRRARRRQGDGG